jgi:hypothetical protein
VDEKPKGRRFEPPPPPSTPVDEAAAEEEEEAPEANDDNDAAGAGAGAAAEEEEDLGTARFTSTVFPSMVWKVPMASTRSTASGPASSVKTTKPKPRLFAVSRL